MYKIYDTYELFRAMC